MQSFNLKLVITAAILLPSVFLIAEAPGNDPGWKAPASAVAKKNPLAKDPNAAKAGASTYARTCSACHGQSGDAGLAGASNLQSPGVQAQSDGALEWKIANGNMSKGMPAFGSIDQTKRWELVRYIRTLKPGKTAAAH